jgi:hypothetical protein
MNRAAVEQSGSLSEAEAQFAERRLSILTTKKPALDVEGAAKIAIKHMPLNDLLFMVAQEIEKRCQFPEEYCADGRGAWADWKYDGERAVDDIKSIARKIEIEGLA